MQIAVHRVTFITMLTTTKSAVPSSKRSLGQFFTKHACWLQPQIIDFIHGTNAKIALDPFAGSGDLLNAVKRVCGIRNTRGYDIDTKLGWDYNDSLVNIPRVADSIVITNPPFLTKYSAKRIGLLSKVKKYFDISSHVDLYQLALEQCFSNEYGVVLVPETFINSSFPKNRIKQITILEDNPFEDTENPICVVCFDGIEKPESEVLIYKNDKYLGTLANFETMRLVPSGHVKIRFNVKSGTVGLRAVDGHNPADKISFLRRDELDYDMAGIKHSSRLITIIEIRSGSMDIDSLIATSNMLLRRFRSETRDVLLSPFKGNNLLGTRRRRLDYRTARAILEKAYQKIATH